MKSFCLLLLCGIAVGSVLGQVPAARGTDNFKKEFFAKYVKEDAQTPDEKAFAAAAATAKCNVCHEGMNKKMRNVYGKALSTLLNKKDKDKEKIQDALEKVANMKSDDANPNSPTFGERIQQGKLPAN